ncbi:MAG TPA: serine hydrolase domain-containing protein, partial [Longimicrobiales bacterium]|nr:serine hydrolase domain-containing protein [Longimicrobiales bacterium]
MIAWRTVRSGLSKRHTSFLAIALWLSAVAAYAQQPDEFINAELLRQRIPGLSLVVLKNGQIITAKGYGLADVKQKTPVTPETVFKIGSVSKQFIATGIMLLVQEGRLGLDDPLSKFLDDAPPAWSPITIRHLLTHTSGLAREGPGFDPFKVQSDADVIRSAYSMALRFSAGEKWEYSNLGYFALAEVIRKVSGHPWSEYLRDQV